MRRKIQIQTWLQSCEWRHCSRFTNKSITTTNAEMYRTFFKLAPYTGCLQSRNDFCFQILLIILKTVRFTAAPRSAINYTLHMPRWAPGFSFISQLGLICAVPYVVSLLSGSSVPITKYLGITSWTGSLKKIRVKREKARITAYKVPILSVFREVDDVCQQAIDVGVWGFPL